MVGKKTTMVFTIGIGYDHFQEGFCDIHHATTVTPAHLEAIIEICNRTILFPGTFDTTDTLCAIADVLGPGNTVELDLNLQHYGTSYFGKGARDPILSFTRWDAEWPKNTLQYNKSTHPIELWAFLFDPLGIHFTIGIAKKNHYNVCPIVHVNLPFDCVEQLDQKMIELLQTEFLSGANVHEIIEKLQQMTGATIRRNPEYDGRKDMNHVELVFLRGTNEQRYDGDMKALKEFLTA